MEQYNMANSMKKLILFSIHFFFFINLFAQIDSIKFIAPDMPETVRLIHNDTVLKYHNSKPFSGIDTVILTQEQKIIAYYENGLKNKVQIYLNDSIKIKEIEFEKGLRHGIEQRWYETGKLHFRIQYFKGKEIGAATSWYPSGKLEGVYLKEGCHNTWYENGMNKSQTIPIEDSLYKHAFMDYMWHENGQLNVVSKSNYGRQLFKAYYENGMPYSEGYIINIDFLMTGLWTYWYENGQKKMQESYLEAENPEMANIKDGVWQWWDEQGNLIREETYKENELLKAESFIKPKQYEGYGAMTKELTLSGKETSLNLSYEFYKEPDELIVYDQNGKELHRTGMRATTKEVTETINIYDVTKLVFKIESKETNSKWKFSVTVE
jgi:antitoxin component YwqK of YwqJK toxin-antitoxin module